MSDEKKLLQEAEPTEPYQEKILLKTLKSIPLKEAIKGIYALIAEQPDDEKKQIVKEISAIAGLPVSIGGPSEHTRDVLWKIVVVSFAFILAGAFLTLALGVFFEAKGKVNPELILTMFTSVIGFLAGLFVPSPVGNRGNSTTANSIK